MYKSSDSFKFDTNSTLGIYGETLKKNYTLWKIKSTDDLFAKQGVNI